MLRRTKCGEDGTLQESIPLAKVQKIDMVDQHNGSHGCNGRCDAWCSGSRTAIASLASLINTTGRTVVKVDVTPGVLEVEPAIANLAPLPPP